jgi:uncharacterized repeat protein (TIGR01451 family)
MKNRYQTISQLVIAVMIILLGLPALVQAAPPTQDPRPPIDNGGGGGGGGSGGSFGDGGSNNGGGLAGCASLTGQIVNWGFGPQANIGAELKTGSWQQAATSASDGNYGIGGLGVGLATLHIKLAPGDAKQFTPLIQDAGVYLNCDYPVIANIALYRGAEVTPPATLQMSAANQTVTPGNDFELTLTVKNSLPNNISNVIVTNMMPRGFKAVQLSSSIKPQDAQIIDGGSDGQLVVVNLDQLAKGATAKIELTINADIDLLGGTKIKNTATLFYRESFAHQASLDFTVASDELSLPAASGNGSSAGAEFVPPANAPTTGGSLWGEDEAETVIPASTVAQPGQEASSVDNFVPPRGMPATGADLLSTMEQPMPVEADSQPKPTINLNLKETGHAYPEQSIPVEAAAIQVLADDKPSPSKPPITAAVGLLFLGLLALGAGFTYLNRRPQ